MLVSRYLQLDVFARTMGGGNPLGVVVDADGWSAEQMQSYACWTNLVETTFLLPPIDQSASYRVRIFTPTREIAFAGHPSVGSAHAVLQCCIAEARDGLLVQECAAGLLEIRSEGVEGERDLFVQSPAGRVLQTGLDNEPRLRGLFADVALGNLPPAFVEGGRRWWLAELADEAELRAHGGLTMRSSANSQRRPRAWACACSPAATAATMTWWYGHFPLALASSKIPPQARPTA